MYYTYYIIYYVLVFIKCRSKQDLTHSIIPIEFFNIYIYFWKTHSRRVILYDRNATVSRNDMYFIYCIIVHTTILSCIIFNNNIFLRNVFNRAIRSDLHPGVILYFIVIGFETVRYDDHVNELRGSEVILARACVCVCVCWVVKQGC